MNLQGSVNPTDRLADRGFGLNEDQREAVDQQHQIGPALGSPGPEGVLGRDQVLVVGRVIVVDEFDGDVFVVGPKGHRLVVAQPLGKHLISFDQAIAAYSQDDGPQLIEHLIGPLRLGRNIRIEADEGLADVLLNKNILRLARQMIGRKIVPAEAAPVQAASDIGRGCFGHPIGYRLRSTEQIADHCFDGVGFGEHSHSSPSWKVITFVCAVFCGSFWPVCV